MYLEEHNSTHAMAAWPLVVAVKVGEGAAPKVSSQDLPTRGGNWRTQVSASGNWVDVVLSTEKGSLDREG